MYQHKNGNRGASRRWGLGLAAAALACAIPGAAWAGSTVTAGDQTLKLNASVSPNQARAGSVLRLQIDYESKLPNQHVPGRIAEIQLRLPERSHINPRSYAQCQLTAIANLPFSQIASHCPRGSVMGGGSFTADARPSLPQPVPGTVTLYNVHGHHNDVLFVGKTQYGYFGYLFVYNGVDPARRTLTANLNNSASPSLFTLKTIDVRLGTPHHKPFITNPPGCPKGGWHSSIYISSYGQEPPISAGASVRCTKRR